MSYIGKGVETVTFNTATTLDVAGNITLGGTVDGRDVATDGTKLDTITSGAIADILQDTTPQLGGNLDLNTSNIIGTGNINVTGSITGTSFVSTGNMSFTNNSKAIFGTSPSLEIYHDGSNSILDDVGAGNFKMQLAGADKLEITSTGVDVTGTVTADGLTFDVADFVNVTAKESLAFTIDSDNNQVSRNFTIFNDGTTQKLFRAEDTGDISFYEDTGTTAKFFWDASAESLGIGTSSPARNLHINGTAASAKAFVRFTHDGLASTGLDVGYSSGGLASIYNAENTAMAFSTNATERMRIDNSGNVKLTSPVNSTGYIEMLRLEGQALSNGWERGIAFTGNSGGLEVSRISSYLTGLERHLRFTSAGVLGMTIRETGSVGIGTSSPDTDISKFGSSAKGLSVAAGQPAITVRATANSQYVGYFGQASTNTYLGARGGGSLIIQTGTSGTERMRITSNGSIRLNATQHFASSAEKLTIVGDSNNQYDACLVMKSGYATGSQAVNGVYFLNNSDGTAGYISWNGTSTSYVTSSDYRLKTAVEYNWDATSRLKQLKPARFEWIADGDDAVPVDGFLAHEVQDVVPEAITGTKDAVDKDGNPEYQGIDQSKLVPLLVKTIQELEARIAALENT